MLARLRRHLDGAWPVAFGLILGTTYLVAVVGGRVIPPSNIEWLRADAVSHYLGWAFLREDHVTALPLTSTNRIGFPLSGSVTYFDPVPALAILFLPFSRALPEPFQYLGAFQCVSGALLFYFAYRFGRLAGGSPAFGVASGVLFLGNSVFTMRLGGHAALTAQFFLVWALYESERLADFQAGSRDRRATFSRLAALVVGALGVNPYIALMTAVIVVTAGLSLCLRAPAERRFVALAGTASLVAYAASAWFFGYIGSGDTLGGPGFQEYSANLNTFVNPLVFSRFAGSLAVARTAQLEGAAYLGVSGIALFIATAIALSTSSAYRTWLGRHVPLVAGAISAFLLALSSRVTLGGTTLFELPLGDTALQALAVFRTVGRFSWLLFYVTYAAGIVAIARLIPGTRGAVVVSALALVQFLELSPLRAGVRAMVRDQGASATPLLDPAWKAIRGRHAHLVVLPAWQCGPATTPGGVAGYATFGLFAAREHLTLNSYYAARYGEKRLVFHCQSLPDEISRKGPALDTAYVVDDNWAAWFRANVSTHACRIADGFNLCVRR